MYRRLAVASTLAAVLAAGALFSPTASANRVAWNVSIGVPGFAISTGQPYWGYGGYYPPYYRAYAPPVYAAPAPVVYSAPYYPYAYPAPVVVRAAPYYGPRRAYYRY
jgi:hypothetical protein